LQVAVRADLKGRDTALDSGRNELIGIRGAVEHYDRTSLISKDVT
jgi:hypothetical protein